MVEVIFISPMGLQEDAVDLFECDGFGLIADGLQHGTDTEVPGLADDPVGGSGDEVEGLVGEGVVSEIDAIELGKNEGRWGTDTNILTFAV